MRILGPATFSLILLASPSLAMTKERMGLLYDTLSLAMRCDAASGLLQQSLADERAHVRAVWTAAGMELGTAMLRGEIDDQDPGYGRRCLTRFRFGAAPDAAPEDAAFAIGFALGEVRGCFAEVFWDNAWRAVPTGPQVGGTTEQEQQDRENFQAYAREEFNSLGCGSIRFPDP
jgi:hypothetical protein